VSYAAFLSLRVRTYGEAILLIFIVRACREPHFLLVPLVILVFLQTRLRFHIPRFFCLRFRAKPCLSDIFLDDSERVLRATGNVIDVGVGRFIYIAFYVAFRLISISRRLACAKDTEFLFPGAVGS